MKSLNEKVNMFNGIVMFVIAMLTAFFATPELVTWVGDQPWGDGVVPTLTFLLGLLTRFYRTQKSQPETENTESEGENSEPSE